MKFVLIDRVVFLDRGRSIRALKSVSLSEEYLADHFPAFPVLPGVLLLEGLVEAASWLVRDANNFAQSMILLEQAANVKYKSFLPPGSSIEYAVEAQGIEPGSSSFKGWGIAAGGEMIVEARLRLRHFNLADTDGSMADVDAAVVAAMKERWRLLTAGGL